MNSFYSMEELQALGLKEVGQDVMISRKASFYRIENIIVGNHVRIDDFCILSGKIELGDYIHVAAYSALYGGEAGIKLDDYVNISSRVTIYSLTDDYSGNSMTGPMIPDEYKKVKSQRVCIGRHVIIGSTSVVMPGVILREGSAFGSFSFVNQDSEAWSINVGIPAKKIKERQKNLLLLEDEFRKESRKDQIE